MMGNGVVSDSAMWRNVVLYSAGTGGRVRRVDLVDVVPRVFVFVLFLVVVVVVVFFVVFFVFVVVVVVLCLFTSAVFFVANRDDLDARGVLVSEVVFVVVEGARMVVDSDSLPESDRNVSVALDVIAALGRSIRNTRRRRAERRARRQRRSARLGRAPRGGTGHSATMREMGYD